MCFEVGALDTSDSSNALTESNSTSQSTSEASGISVKPSNEPPTPKLNSFPDLFNFYFYMI